MRKAVSRLLEEGLLEFVQVQGRRQAVATPAVNDPADLVRVQVVIEALAGQDGGRG